MEVRGRRGWRRGGGGGTEGRKEMCTMITFQFNKPFFEGEDYCEIFFNFLKSRSRFKSSDYKSCIIVSMLIIFCFLSFWKYLLVQSSILFLSFVQRLSFRQALGVVPLTPAGSTRYCTVTNWPDTRPGLLCFQPKKSCGGGGEGRGGRGRGGGMRACVRVRDADLGRLLR